MEPSFITKENGFKLIRSIQRMEISCSLHELQTIPDVTTKNRS